MTRYADDLKKLVGIDKLRKELEDQIEKSRILGQRGTGYALSDGSVAGANSALGAAANAARVLGSAETAAQKSATDAALEALANAQQGGSGGTEGNDDGATGGDAGDQGAISDGDQGMYDVEDILNGQPPVGSDFLLKGMSGVYDPVSGRWINVREDGYYRAPSDRLTPDEDGTVLGFYAGVRWYTSSLATRYQSAGMAIEGERDYRQSLADAAFGVGEALYEITVVTPPSEDMGLVNTGTYRGRQTMRDGTFSEGAIVLSVENCTAGSGSDCPLAPDSAYKWPSGKPLELGKNAQGQFVANDRDTDIPAIHSVASNSLVFSYGDGSLYVAQKPTRDGGFVIGASDSSGVFTDTIRVFSAAGQAIGNYPASTASTYVLP